VVKRVFRSRVKVAVLQDCSFGLERLGLGITRLIYNPAVLSGTDERSRTLWNYQLELVTCRSVDVVNTVQSYKNTYYADREKTTCSQDSRQAHI